MDTKPTGHGMQQVVLVLVVVQIKFVIFRYKCNIDHLSMIVSPQVFEQSLFLLEASTTATFFFQISVLKLEKIFRQSKRRRQERERKWRRMREKQVKEKFLVRADAAQAQAQVAARLRRRRRR